jgi:hypothetical protein
MEMIVRSLRKFLRWHAPALLVAVLVMGSTSARAGLTTSFAGMTSTPTTATFNYSLSFTIANFNGSDQLTTGNYLTLYDLTANLADFASFSTSPFTASESLLGTTPSFASPKPPDDPNLFNLTLTYNGPTLTADTNFNISFTLNGQYTTAVRDYSSLNVYIPNSGGTGQTATVGAVQTPMASALPEPSSLVLLGIAGLTGLALRRWRDTRYAA